MHTLLGFDFGLKRIGVAVGQQVTNTATALEIVSARNGRPDWEAITALVETWQPEALVVGLPRHADGSASEFTHAVERFVRQLEGRYGLPVHTMDERLSSRAATDLQNPAGADRGSRDIDAVAAGIILQNWMESH